MKKLNLLRWMMVVAVVVMMTACGGGDSISDKLYNNDQVIITYHYPESTCYSNDLKNTLKMDNPQAYNWTFFSTSSHVTCSTYGKFNDNHECLEQDTYKNEYTKTCVVGLDLPGYSPYNKLESLNNDNNPIEQSAAIIESGTSR